MQLVDGEGDEYKLKHINNQKVLLREQPEEPTELSSMLVLLGCDPFMRPRHLRVYFSQQYWRVLPGISMGIVNAKIKAIDSFLYAYIINILSPIITTHTFIPSIHTKAPLHQQCNFPDLFNLNIVNITNEQMFHS